MHMHMHMHIHKTNLRIYSYIYLHGREQQTDDSKNNDSKIQPIPRTAKISMRRSIGSQSNNLDDHLHEEHQRENDIARV